mmetsp:Transcript_7149/g.17951  ORF Transcript_7149/g.17951 Transcript_7149/m.17951 type:complete len:334 (+) Transcript_7149:800-1801(+)
MSGSTAAWCMTSNNCSAFSAFSASAKLAATASKVEGSSFLKICISKSMSSASLTLPALPISLALATAALYFPSNPSSGRACSRSFNLAFATPWTKLDGFLLKSKFFLRSIRSRSAKASPIGSCMSATTAASSNLSCSIFLPNCTAASAGEDATSAVGAGAAAMLREISARAAAVADIAGATGRGTKGPGLCVAARGVTVRCLSCGPRKREESSSFSTASFAPVSAVGATLAAAGAAGAGDALRSRGISTAFAEVGAGGETPKSRRIGAAFAEAGADGDSLRSRGSWLRFPNVTAPPVGWPWPPNVTVPPVAAAPRESVPPPPTAAEEASGTRP